MPIFEYSCRDCGFSFEMLVKSSDVISCPQCGGGHVTKLFSAFAYRSSGQGEAPSTKSSCSSCTAKSCSSCV